jgi:ABC-2 type transport system ATP-binding protein
MEYPELLVLDEPTNALDENGVELIRNVILEEQQRGATVLIASHNKEDIKSLCSRQFKMTEGKLEEAEED